MVEAKRVGTIALVVAEWFGVVVFALIGVVIAVVVVMLAWVGDAPEPMGNSTLPATGAAAGVEPLAAVVQRELPPASAEERDSLFAPVYDVLVSPRCMNCHPAGDRPLSDRDGVHPMNVSRDSFEAGLLCSTCHGDTNTELPGSPLGPPGALHWQLPPRDTPMIFQDRTITALCKQLRDPAQNGERTLAALHEHVQEDPLVLWAWKPGGQRATPAVSHAAFVESFVAWVDAGGVCPGETLAPEPSDAPESP